MNREQKAVAIAEIAGNIDDSQAIFAVDYRGITVAEVAALRARLREADASFTVVKNSLTERAADQAGAEGLKEFLSGPTALTFVRGDAAVAAKAIADYARATQLLPFKGGLMEGASLDGEQIRSLSRLPSRQVLYGQLVGVVASPLSGLARSLGNLLGGLAVALGQVRDKKESGEVPAGEAPVADPPAEPEATPDGGQPAPGGEKAEPHAEGAEQGERAEPEAEAAEQGERAEPEAEASERTDDNEADVSAESQTEDAETNPTKED